MHHPSSKFGENITTIYLDTGPAPKSLTMSGRRHRRRWRWQSISSQTPPKLRIGELKTIWIMQKELLYCKFLLIFQSIQLKIIVKTSRYWDKIMHYIALILKLILEKKYAGVLLMTSCDNRKTLNDCMTGEYQPIASFWNFKETENIYNRIYLKNNNEESLLSFWQI